MSKRSVQSDKKGWYGKEPETQEMRDKLRQRAQELRRNLTPPEKRLWIRLDEGKMHGYKFRCQHVIYRYIVDFYCADARLVIEVDGATHDETDAYDDRRTAYLELRGLKIMRFTNNEIMNHLDSVLAAISQYLLKNDL